MGLVQLLSRFWKYVSASGPKDISKARAIEIATKFYQERDIPTIRVGIAWRTRDEFVMTANADAIGGGLYVPIDRRSGEAREPISIER